MTISVDLNADMGESFGPWVMGQDAALLDVVTSANIACGFHAGDPDTMAQTMRLAAKRNVGIGAHPGFDDLQGFGRRRMSLSPESLTNMIQYQLGAAQAVAHANGAELRHFKLHGALANMASENRDMALNCYKAALAVAPDITILVLAQTAQQDAARELGCLTACEIFADRAYLDDCTLVDRNEPNAVIHNPEEAAQRVVDMVQSGTIHAVSGKRIETRIDTVCMHGDTPEAVAIAKTTRTALEASGVTVSVFKCAPIV